MLISIWWQFITIFIGGGKMFNYVTRFLLYFRPCFSRGATFNWFIVAFVGLMLREDNLGVTSIVRVLVLPPNQYLALLRHFHSSALDLKKLLRYWWCWVAQSNLAYQYNGNPVLIGDHTKIPKDGRLIPAVATLHQESETSSKPSYFRGHNWGCISMLTGAGKMLFSTPLWAQIHQPLNLEWFEEKNEPMTTRMVSMALDVAKTIGKNSTFVLDAFFAAAPVFDKIYEDCKIVTLTILTRAKKNVVAYFDPIRPKKKGRGRPAKYGKKIKLFKKFFQWRKRFLTVTATIYGKDEIIQYYSLPLMWRPLKGKKLLFIWADTSRGKMVLMSSDLNMDPVKAIELYCYRVKIETLFSILKNVFGVSNYHFWSLYLSPQSRRPRKKDKKHKRISLFPEKTLLTLHAIETLFNMQTIVVGFLQLCCMKFTKEVSQKANTWLRTFNPKKPSEFMAKKAIEKVFFKHFCLFTKNPIMDLIRSKQKGEEIEKNFQMSA